jgi:hypothetical protein
MKNIIFTLPEDLIYDILDYHPLFFSYKREFIKSLIINDMYHEETLVNKKTYKNLLLKYPHNYSKLFIHKFTISYDIIIHFETNIFNNDHVDMSDIRLNIEQHENEGESNNI